MALRAAAAKGVAVGLIGAIIAVALLVRAPYGKPDLPASVTARVLPMGLIPLVDAGSDRLGALGSRRVALDPRPDGAPSRVSPHARGSEPATVQSRTLTWSRLSQTSPRSIGTIQPSEANEPEPEPLASRAMTFVVEPTQIANGQVALLQPPRGGALTRAMGTTAGAFRTAGTSVASALKKVF